MNQIHNDVVTNIDINMMSLLKMRLTITYVINVIISGIIIKNTNKANIMFQQSVFGVFTSIFY